jgi:hypothetical protein
MTTVNLRALIRDIAENSSLRGPREIAAKVAENIPAKQVRAALAEALVAYVREELTRARATSAPVLPGNVNSARSSKVAAIRDAWRRTLAGQFHVGAGVWQRLADCSREQVMFLAAERREMAERNAAAADMFDRLGAAMRKRHAKVVADLSEPVLAELLSAAVAS